MSVETTPKQFAKELAHDLADKIEDGRTAPYPEVMEMLFEWRYRITVHHSLRNRRLERLAGEIRNLFQES